MNKEVQTHKKSKKVINYVQGPSGGNHGSDFNDDEEATSSSVISRLSFRWNNDTMRYIKTIFTLSSGKKVERTHGDDSGEHTLDIDTEDGKMEIVKVTVYTHDYSSGRVAGIKIETSKSSTHMAGKETNTINNFATPEGYKVIAFCGRAGLEIDALGVVYGKQTE